MTQEDKDAACRGQAAQWTGGGHVGLAKNMTHLFWHSDGILDLEGEPKIY